MRQDMRPEDVPQEWVAKATRAWRQWDCGVMQPRCSLLQFILAAVAPLIQAAAYEECAKVAEQFTSADWIAHDMRTGSFPKQGKPGPAIAEAIREKGARS